jgi:hypothetical protein
MNGDTDESGSVSLHALGTGFGQSSAEIVGGGGGQRALELPHFDSKGG